MSVICKLRNVLLRRYWFSLLCFLKFKALIMSETFETTTDALPSQPRGDENKWESNNGKTAKEYQSTANERNRSGTNSPPLRGSKNSKSKKKPGSGNFFIHVVDSPYAHVGHVFHSHNYNTACTKHSLIRKEDDVKETEQTAAIKKNKKPVTSEDIDAVACHIGNGWENTFTQLGFDDNQILIYKQKCSKNVEINKALLRDWTRKNGKDNATVGVLAQVLWNTNQRKAVKIWASTYDLV
ncbi:uncharacterized protein LOC109540911 [Dendroctonus ponderosae]